MVRTYESSTRRSSASPETVLAPSTPATHTARSVRLRMKCPSDRPPPREDITQAISEAPARRATLRAIICGTLLGGATGDTDGTPSGCRGPTLTLSARKVLLRTSVRCSS